MTTTVKPEPTLPSPKDEEEKLLKALLGRELLVTQEAKDFLAGHPRANAAPRNCSTSS